MEEDHTPSVQLPPEPQVNSGIKCENNLEGRDTMNGIREETFHEIKASDPENIALMTSNLNLNPREYVIPGEIQVL